MLDHLYAGAFGKLAEVSASAMSLAERDNTCLLDTHFVPGAGSILALAQLPGWLCGEDQACDPALSVQVLRADATTDDAMPAKVFGADGQWARSSPVATYDGHGFARAFSQARIEAPRREGTIRMLHVEPNGTVAAEPSIVLRTLNDSAADEPLTIATAGDGYLLVFAHGSLHRKASPAWSPRALPARVRCRRPPLGCHAPSRSASARCASGAEACSRRNTIRSAPRAQSGRAARQPGR